MSRINHDIEKLIEFLIGYGFDESRRDNEWESSSCPVCSADEKAGRVWVNVRLGYVNCYSCGGRKNIFGWVMDVEGCTFREAKALVGEGEDRHYDADTMAEVFAPAPDDLALEWPTLPVHDVAWLGNGGEPQGWGASAVAAVEARGFSLDWMRMKACGLGAGGRWAGRVILPAFYRQRLVWWQGWDWTREEEIKYDSPVVPKGVLGRRHILFQWDLYGAHERVVLTEGVYNAWACEQLQWPALACFGKALSPEQLALLIASPIREVIVAFDADAADKANAVAWDLIEIGKQARVLRYPDDRDLNDLDPRTRTDLLISAGPPEWLADPVTSARSLR